MFVLLATGLVAQTARRTVVGMLAATGVAAVVSFHACCRFFSHHRWDVDRIGLVLARLIVDRLLDAGAPIDGGGRRHAVPPLGAARCSARSGPMTASAQDPNALGRGNRWVIARASSSGCRSAAHPVCLPVLLRLWRGRGTASPVQLARELILLLAQEFPDRCIHAVGDAAYHGKALLVERTTITTRLPANAALYAPAPPRTGKRGRPRLQGPPARHTRPRSPRPRPGDTVTVSRYGQHATPSRSPCIDSIWYGAFGNTEGRTVLVREPGEQKVLAIFTTDTDSDTETVVARYAHRWPIEIAIAAGKQLLGIGQARNRLQRAVERTVPLASASTASSSSGTRCTATTPTTSPHAAPIQPWYSHKDELAFEDMLAKLRRTLVAARITGVAAAQPDPRQIPRLRTGLRRSRRVTAKVKNVGAV